MVFSSEVKPQEKRTHKKMKLANVDDDDDDEDDGALNVIMQGQIFEPSSSQRRYTLGITFTCGFGEHPILCWSFGLTSPSYERSSLNPTHPNLCDFKE
jgi:hypothetical protein